MVTRMRFAIPGTTNFAVATANSGWLSEPRQVAPASAMAGLSDHEDGRVGIAQELPAVLLDLGFDPDEVIASADIDPRTSDDGGRAP
jgi:hypothetical protein